MSKNSTTTSVTIAISEMIDIIKLSVANTLVEKSKDLDLDRKKLQKLNALIESAITNSYVNSMDNVIKKIKE